MRHPAVRYLKRSPPGQQFGAQGAGRWQKYPMHATTGGCRAERAKWGLKRAGERAYGGLEPEQKMEIPV
jgi:hypothetical protein